MKQFHLGDILSITTGKLVSPRHVEGVYEILNYMTDDNLYTHQLPRASKECAPELIHQHPELAGVTGDDVTEKNWKDWLAAQVKRFGATLPVEPIPRNRHGRLEPYQELVDMVGEDRVIVIGGDEDV